MNSRAEREREAGRSKREGNKETKAAQSAEQEAGRSKREGNKETKAQRS